MEKLILKNWKFFWRLGFVVQWFGALASVTLYFLSGWLWSLIAFAVCLSGYLLTVCTKGLIQESLRKTAMKDPLLGIYGKARRRIRRKIEAKHGKITDIIK